MVSSNRVKSSLNNIVKSFAVIMMIVLTVMVSSNCFSASAETSKKVLSAPKMISSKNIDSDFTHPYNRQTNQIVVHWTPVKGATKYRLYIKGGKYKKWTSYRKVADTKCTVSGLSRSTQYSFKVKALNTKASSDFSGVQKLSTARMNFDKAGWEAMCRIVYHEVGMINTAMWDKPIVYVADCVVNRYVQAKYLNHPTWAPFYRGYSNIQSVIYSSGGFMSSEQLARDGASYYNVPLRVKKAVVGAVYGCTTYKGIQNDYNVFYWCNRSYKQNSSKIAYSFRIPWGYFNVWRSYWG